MFPGRDLTQVEPAFRIRLHCQRFAARKDAHSRTPDGRAACRVDYLAADNRGSLRHRAVAHRRLRPHGLSWRWLSRYRLTRRWRLRIERKHGGYDRGGDVCSESHDLTT